MKCETIILLYSLLLPSITTQLSYPLLHPKACNRTVRTSVGWIRWTGRMGRCVVRIRAPLRDPQVIELRIRRFQVGMLKNSICEGAYVQFSDGIEDLEDDVGRYCGHVNGNATRLFLRKGAELNIVMNSDGKFADENPVIFTAQYSILPARLAAERHRGNSLFVPSAGDCSLECSDENYHRRCRITSPGYPGVYPRGIGCRISLESSAGRFKIGGVYEDVFNTMNYTLEDGCRTENCEELRAEKIERREREKEEEEEDDDGEIIVDRRIGERGKRNIKNFDYHLDEEEDEIIIMGSDVRQRRLKPIDSSNVRERKSRMRKWRKKKSRRKTKRRGKKINDNNMRRNLKIFDDDEAEEKETEKSEIEFGNDLMNNLKRKYLGKKNNGGELLVRNFNCVMDYLTIYEKLGGEVIEITRFCGTGKIPEIISRGRNIVIEFSSNRDGTIMHDGFHLTLEESESSDDSQVSPSCDFVYKSKDRAGKETIKSFKHWYPPSTFCSYKFVAKTSERIYLQLKIYRNYFIDNEKEISSRENARRNYSTDLIHGSINYCPGNEITVYNGASSNDSLAWSYCDYFHSDINNIQVPITSTGNLLFVQYYSAKGSFNGEEFTYGISFKFLKKASSSSHNNNNHNHNHNHNQRQEFDKGDKKQKKISNRISESKRISLKPVNFSALNITDYDNCNCDFSTRIGTFKSWFIVLVVLGVISFIGALLTIVALLTKCLNIRSVRENKLLQTPKR